MLALMTTKERLLPQLPGMAKKHPKTLLSIGSGLSYIVGVLIFIITPPSYIYSVAHGNRLRM